MQVTIQYTIVTRRVAEHAIYEHLEIRRATEGDPCVRKFDPRGRFAQALPLVFEPVATAYKSTHGRHVAVLPKYVGRFSTARDTDGDSTPKFRQAKVDCGVEA